MLKSVKLGQPFGTLQPGVEYMVASEGYDFYKLRAQGRLIVVPKYLVSKDLDPAILQEKAVIHNLRETKKKYNDTE